MIKLGPGPCTPNVLQVRGAILFPHLHNKETGLEQQFSSSGPWTSYIRIMGAFK